VKIEMTACSAKDIPVGDAFWSNSTLFIRINEISFTRDGQRGNTANAVGLSDGKLYFFANDDRVTPASVKIVNM